MNDRRRGSGNERTIRDASIMRGDPSSFPFWSPITNDMYSRTANISFFLCVFLFNPSPDEPSQRPISSQSVYSYSFVFLFLFLLTYPETSVLCEGRLCVKRAIR